MRRLFAVFAVLVALLAIAAAPATAASGSAVISDCNSHGRLTRQYSTAQLRNALSTMPADVKEYTDCLDVIQRALLANVGGNHESGSGSGNSSGSSFLPTWLIVVLVLLALAAVTLGAVAIRRRRGGPPASG